MTEGQFVALLIGTFFSGGVIGFVLGLCSVEEDE